MVVKPENIKEILNEKNISVHVSGMFLVPRFLVCNV